MIKIFERTNGKVKIYFNELPHKNDCNEASAHKSYYADCEKNFNSYFIGIEAMRHTGPRMLYGMLGARVAPNNEHKLNINILYQKENKQIFENTMLLDKGYVYTGLLEEYLEGVFEGSEVVVANVKTVPSIDINFEVAANDKSGSCHTYFSELAQLIIRLIAEGNIENLMCLDNEEFVEKCAGWNIRLI